MLMDLIEFHLNGISVSEDDFTAVLLLARSKGLKIGHYFNSFYDHLGRPHLSFNLFVKPKK